MLKASVGVSVLVACAALIFHKLDPKIEEEREASGRHLRDRGKESPRSSAELVRRRTLTNVDSASDSRKKMDLRDSSVESQSVAVIKRLWEARKYQEVSLSFGELLAAEPEAAISFVADLRDPYAPMHFSPELFEFFGSLPMSEALERSARLQNKPEVAVSVIADVYADFVKQDQEAALMWLLQQDPEFAQRLGYRSTLGGHFKNYAESLDQILEIEKGALRENLVTGLVESWLLNRPHEITDRLNRAPLDRIYDRAIFNYLDSAALVNPVDALTWADSIAEENLRFQAVEKVKSVWSQSAPEEFARWQESDGRSEAE